MQRHLLALGQPTVEELQRSTAQTFNFNRTTTSHEKMQSVLKDHTVSSWKMGGYQNGSFGQN